MTESEVIAWFIGVVGGCFGIIMSIRSWTKDSSKIDVQIVELKTLVNGISKTLKELKIVLDKVSDDVYADLDKLKEDIIILKKDKERFQHALDELKETIKSEKH